MKKNIKIILMGVLVLLSATAFFLSQKKEPVEIKSKDARLFKEEYEVLNNAEIKNYPRTYLPIEIPKNNPVDYASEEEIDQVLSETGVIYFGYPECPWCRNLVPVLMDAAKQTNTKKVYYINMKEERNQLKLNDEGKIETIKEGTPLYHKLVEKLNDHLLPYEGLNDETIKRIYVPFVIFVKDGKIVDTHTGSLDSQVDPFVPLTDEQKTELKKTLMDKFLKLSDSVCTDAC